ncbi:hypothetical protein ACJJTC_004250 [Scirpophaga incertulas]
MAAMFVISMIYVAEITGSIPVAGWVFSAGGTSRLLSDPVALERRLAAAGHDAFAALADPPDHQDPPPTIIEERLHHRPVASIVAVVPRGALAPSPRPPPIILPPQEPSPPPLRLPLDMAVRGSEPETLSYEVALSKDVALGLGITVAGYVCEQEELSGIFVKSISEGSSADLCGKIQVNDRIVEVRGFILIRILSKDCLQFHL